MSAVPASHPPLARGPSVTSNELDLDEAKAHEHDASHAAALILPPSRVREGALVDSMEAYRAMYDRSVKEPRAFWAEMARAQLTWFRPFSDDQVLNGSFQEGNVRWFADGQLNISYNCIDRHVSAGRGDQIAIIHEGDESGQSRTVTYSQLLSEVCRVANVLTAAGVKCVSACRITAVSSGVAASSQLPLIPPTHGLHRPGSHFPLLTLLFLFCCCPRPAHFLPLALVLVLALALAHACAAGRVTS